MQNTSLSLSKSLPVNSHNVVALLVTSAAGDGGVVNTGFWGISVVAGQQYHLSIYLRRPANEAKVWFTYMYL